MVEVEGIDDVPVEDIDDEVPAARASRDALEEGGEEEEARQCLAGCAACGTRARGQRRCDATPARSSRWDGAYLAVLLAALWLFANELVSLSRGATSVLVEKPVNLATGCLRWCLRPVFAARSFLMSFLRAARDDAKAD